MSHLVRWHSLIVPIGVVACVLVLMTPLPAWSLDVLLAANIAVALIVLLTAIQVKTPLEFSVFPSLLLATTLSRLVLNVATTRLILTQAPHAGLDAAGQVIRAFGEFVAGNQTVVGVVIFAIIVVIQFVVITKGATRISEVAARFALDGMPGRQMAIDADLNAGLIDEHEAQSRRELIGQQADFYGAMDGASKFVRGDAVAGIVITLINILGGLAIGTLQYGMSPAEAGSLFTRLTIGDGLVTQVPALFISLGAGLLVTRSSRPVDLPSVLLRQLFTRPQVLAVAAVFLGLLVFTRLPAVPLLVLGTGCGVLAYLASRHRPAEETNSDLSVSASVSPTVPAEKPIETFLAVEPMELEIGVGLLRLADPNRGGDLLAQITDVRRRMAAELGILLPKVRICDNMRLGNRGYRIKIAGDPISDGAVYPDRLLAIAHDGKAPQLPGRPAYDPASDRPAVWIDPSHVAEAKRERCTIVEATSVLAAHLRQVVRQNAGDLLTRDATKHLIDELKKTAPAVVEELIPDAMRLGDVQQVLKLLLEEGVPIRQLGLILETLGDHASSGATADVLAEFVRRRLARTICSRYRDEEGLVHAVTIDPSLEERILAGVRENEHGWSIRLTPQAIRDICTLIDKETEKLTRAGIAPVVLTSAEARPVLRQITAARLPRLVVLSYEEITRDTTVRSAGIVGEAAMAAA